MPDKPKPAKVTANRMVQTVKAVLEAGLEKEFIEHCDKGKFFLAGGERSMKVAIEFLHTHKVDERNQKLTMALEAVLDHANESLRPARVEGQTLLARVQQTCGTVDPQCRH